MTTTTTTTTAPITRDALADQFEREGWLPGKPLYLFTDTVAMDFEVAFAADCDHCGHHSLQLVPYRRRDRQRGYRCLAWCPVCEAAIEM
jgi:hypothetical protein